MKKIIAVSCLLMLIVTMLCTSVFGASFGLSNFKSSDTYKDGMFTDVDEVNWYAQYVKASVNYGLMKGESNVKFSPAGNVTWAEAITIAARIHSIYHSGTEKFAEGRPWYKPYAEYALENGIVSVEPNNYSKTITRADFVLMLYSAVDNDALRVKNSVTDGFIPDVKGAESYGPAVYALYRAGVLIGDTKHNFHPMNNITRGETAAVVSRIANTDLRQTVTLDASTLPDDGSQTTNEGTDTTGNQTSNDILNTISQSRQALALAQQNYAAAQLSGISAENYATALANAKRYDSAAAGYAQQASVAIEKVYGKTSLYTQTYYAYLGCMSALNHINAISTPAPTTTDWASAANEMAAAAELLAKAYNQLSI